MRAFALLLAVALPGCDSVTDFPRLLDASADCDEGEQSWRLEAETEHDGGPDRIVSLHFDAAILLMNGDFADTQFIGSHSLAHEGDGLWALDLPLGTTQLDCGFDGEYLLTVTAEDDDGDQAAGQIRIDGFGVRVE